MTGDAVYDNERSYWESRLGEDVPLNSVGYHGLSDAYVAWLYRIRARRFQSVVRPFVRPGMRVLDAGSGGGFYVSLWQRLGVDPRAITATDLTQASLKALERRFPGVHTAQFDLGSSGLPAAPGSFDAISCMDVLHHLMDDAAYERAIQNCAQLLRPGGALIFTDNFLHGPAYRGPHHVSRPLAQIEGAARAAGLQVRVRKPMFVLMNNPIDSRSALFKFYWKALSFASEFRPVGAVTGAVLYPMEVALTAVLPEGPSTEIAVAVKP
jgi:2-polyprenyl-3-methyl-5-hydroxy-6-metoxy-1,4-benzoquinol methylase